MRILFIHNTYQQSGGEDAVVSGETKLLRSAGHNIQVYLFDNSKVRTFGDKIITSVQASWSWRSYQLITARIHSFRPDIVHVHNFFPLVTPAVFAACNDAGVPVVLTLHNYRLTCAAAILLRNGEICEKCVTGSAWWGAVHRCYRGSLAGSIAVARMIDVHRRAGTWHDRVDRFIALTEFQKRKMVAAGLPEHKLAVKPNFLAAPPAVTMPRLEPRFGALFVGRLAPEKGVSFLVEAWRSVDYPLTIVGDGPLAAALRRDASDQVTFLGHQDRTRVLEEMRKAAFLVMPSLWYEGLPMTLVEAYAAGLPVLASDLGAMAELVQPGVTGWTFAAGNANVLQIALARMIDHPPPSESCRQRFEDRYTAAVNLPQLEAIYAAATKERRDTAR